MLAELFEELASREAGKVVVSEKLYAGVAGDERCYADVWNDLRRILNDDVGRTIAQWRRCFHDDRDRWQCWASQFVAAGTTENA